MSRFLTCLTVLALSSAFAQLADNEPIGIVSQLQGKWTRMQDQKVLTLGDEVFPGNTVRSDPSTNYSIRIALFDGTVWGKACTAQNPCDGGSYRVTVQGDGDRSFLSFLKTYFVARKRIPNVFMASRGIGSEVPQEAVLVLQSDLTVDLLPALHAIPPGRWRVTLSSPTQSRDTGATQFIDLPQNTVFKGTGLARGLYALDVQNAAGEPKGPPAAVLLTGPDGAQSEQIQFDRARYLTQHWDGVDTTTARAFLVQTLYAIQLGMQP